MALITLSGADLAFGHVPLLHRADFSLARGERVGLIGRNGSGKSSLLKILAGSERLDDGVLLMQRGVQIACVAQEPVLDEAENVFNVVSAGLADLVELLGRFTESGGALDGAHDVIEARGGWAWRHRVEETLQRLRLPPDAAIRSLSGGTRKRVALAQALVRRPDILLLDEPTNHLDIDTIEWLADLLNEFPGSVVFVTHDRAFLDSVATRIVELDRGRLLSFPGNFSEYRTLKDAQFMQEATVHARADKLLAQEEEWIRKGVEARRTRAAARIERLAALRAARADRRTALGRARMELARGQSSGRIVVELDAVSKSFGDRPVIRDFSATLLRGDKVGLIGPNGAGKSTLLKLILGELLPDSGRVRLGARLQVAYFDQMREALDPDSTLRDFINPGGEWIEIGQERKHVMRYLSDFLFAPERANALLRSLSGGERNRLLLARLFARPANVLVLDEPTNDLDIETLELLEALIQDYKGTVFLVSHDRAFLDNVVTSTIAFEGDGVWREYEGGVQDWLTQSRRVRDHAMRNAISAPAVTPNGSQSCGRAESAKSEAKTPTVAPSRRKLSYKDQQALDQLPAMIEALEREQSEINAELSAGTVYSTDPERALQLAKRSAAIEDALMEALERWEALGG